MAQGHHATTPDTHETALDVGALVNACLPSSTRAAISSVTMSRATMSSITMFVLQHHAGRLPSSGGQLLRLEHTLRLPGRLPDGAGHRGLGQWQLPEPKRCL